MTTRPARLRRRSKPSLRTRFGTYWVLVALLLAALAYGLWLLASAPAFRLGTLDVSGLDQVSRDEVVAKAALDPHSNVWLFDVHDAEQRLEAIPYVASARIHRSLPGNVRIDIVERVPEACARAAGGASYTVDATLRVLATGCLNAPHVDYVSHAPIVAQPGAFLNDGELTEVRRDAQALTATGQHYTRFDLDRYGDLEATLAGGIRVRFGDDDDLEPKERLVGPILASLADRLASVRALDLRAPTTPVVEYR